MAIQLSDIAAGQGGFVINGENAGDRSGFSVAGIGDVNGDGLGDLLIGAPDSDYSTTTTTDTGRSYVVFGKTDMTAVDLDAVAAGDGGFVINSLTDFPGGFDGYNSSAGRSVSAAGDVNGDGLADLIVGAPGTHDTIGAHSGRTYVVFGKADGSPVDMQTVKRDGTGFVINTWEYYGSSGFSVSGGGDINGDGLDDLIIGAPGGDHAYVVFGKVDSNEVERSDILAGRGGFAIDIENYDRKTGSSVSSAGDVNGDGLCDILIGAPGQYSIPPGGAENNGRTYVVFGKADGSAVQLDDVVAGDGGFVVNGPAQLAYSGSSVAGAGDVNGDGLADLFIGAPRADVAGKVDAGIGYVVFGRSSTSAVELTDVADGRGGYAVVGEAAHNGISLSVAQAGDINGDGLSDLILGAPAVASRDGRSYVVFGKTDGTQVELSAVAAGVGGFAIDGSGNEHAGAVQAAGDVNGDGLADLIVGAPSGLRTEATGRSYVIFGAIDGAFGQTAVDQIGSGANDRLVSTSAAQTLIGGAGNDVLVGNGGADVLYGGAGSDVFVVNAGNLRALMSGYGAGGNTQQLARVDGGTGIDTLRLAGTGLVFDLTDVADQGGSAASSSRIEAVERIDLTGSGDNLVRLDVGDVRDMAGMNTVNAATQDALGWSNGSYEFLSVERRHQLIVEGDAGDTLAGIAADWQRVGTVFRGDNQYVVYKSPQGRAEVIVDSDVRVAHAAPGRAQDHGRTQDHGIAGDDVATLHDAAVNNHPVQWSIQASAIYLRYSDVAPNDGMHHNAYDMLLC